MNKPQYFTPVLTAFLPDGNIDPEANIRIWDRLIENGMSGIVIMGSTGEFFTMNNEQKRQLIMLAGTHLKGRTQFFAGTGNMRMDDTVELSNFAFENGADGVMIVGPYYFGLSDASVELYFSTVADGVRGNIFLYNFPDRTSYDLKPEIALKLVKKHSNIVGYKDTVGSMNHTRELITTMRGNGCDEFIIMSGSDTNFAHTMISGGNGCIGATSNLYPELCSAWMKALIAEDLAKVSAIQKVMDRVNFAGVGAFFIPVLKKALMLRGVEMYDACQFPFISCSEEQTIKIQMVLNELDPQVKAVIS